MNRAVPVVVATILAVLSGCATVPPRGALVPEYAAPAAQYGPLADYAGRIQGMLASGESAHWLLDRNELAFTARLALADEAAATLDIQYFIWQDDASGELMALRLLAAADRGVRVRLLLDDFGVATDRGEILRLDAHPLIDVRTFNPWASRGSRIRSAVEFLRRAYELNRRMHNKTFIADNRFAIVGGRNIGDRYFGIYDRFVQDDLDVLVAGPLAREVTGTFDEYWNSEHAFPVALFAADDRPRAPIDTTRGALAAGVAANAELLRSFPLEPADWSDYFEELVDTFAAGRASILSDTPDILDDRAF